MRAKAVEFDKLAERAPERPTKDAELVRLLHQIDGQLGLAVHRGNLNNEQWKLEAEELIGRIRKLVKSYETGVTK